MKHAEGTRIRHGHEMVIAKISADLKKHPALAEAKKLRSEDAYTPGGEHGFRPDYATTVYSQILKKIYPEVPVLIGGIEASLRRVTHYDYWSDTLKPGILAAAVLAAAALAGGAEPARAQSSDFFVPGQQRQGGSPVQHRA